MGDQPLRRALISEVHARPFAQVTVPQRASHLALLTGEDSADDRAGVAALCAAHGVPPSGPEDSYMMADLGPFRLRWERHTESSSDTFFQSRAVKPWARRASSMPPRPSPRRVAELCEARFQGMPTICGVLGRRPRPGSLNLTENQGRIT